MNSFYPTFVFFPSVLRHLATCEEERYRVIVFVPYRLMKVKMNNTKAEKVMMSMINAFHEYRDNEDMIIRYDDDIEGEFPQLLQCLCECKPDFSVLVGLCYGQMLACLLGFLFSSLFTFIF